MIDYEGSLDRHIPLVEFVYNNSFQSSIGMASYKAFYGRKCRMSLCWTKLSENKVIGPDLIQETEEKVKMIRERLKVATDRQKSYADMKRKDIRYEIGEKVFLKVSPWKKLMRFGKKGKLSPRFFEPYEVSKKWVQWHIVWHYLRTWRISIMYFMCPCYGGTVQTRHM